MATDPSKLLMAKGYGTWGADAQFISPEQKKLQIAKDVINRLKDDMKKMKTQLEEKDAELKKQQTIIDEMIDEQGSRPLVDMIMGDAEKDVGEALEDAKKHKEQSYKLECDVDIHRRKIARLCMAVLTQNGDLGEIQGTLRRLEVGAQMEMEFAIPKVGCQPSAFTRKHMGITQGSEEDVYLECERVVIAEQIIQIIPSLFPWTEVRWGFVDGRNVGNPVGVWSCGCADCFKFHAIVKKVAEPTR